MKYKVIQNKMIIAVLDELTYVKQQRNGVIVPCSKEKSPCGIISEEGFVWHLEGLPDFLQGDYETVSVTEISEAEYEELKAALTVDEEIAEPVPPAEDTPGDSAEEDEAGENESGEKATQEGEEQTAEGGTETVPEKEPVMSIAEMRQRIIPLRVLYA